MDERDFKFLNRELQENSYKLGSVKIFFTSYFQIGLVVLNTILIQKSYLIGIFLASFTISMLWCYNVSKVSVSGLKSKVVYSLGSGLGALSAYFFMKLFG